MFFILSRASNLAIGGPCRHFSTVDQMHVTCQRAHLSPTPRMCLPGGPIVLYHVFIRNLAPNVPLISAISEVAQHLLIFRETVVLTNRTSAYIAVVTESSKLPCSSMHVAADSQPQNSPTVTPLQRRRTSKMPGPYSRSPMARSALLAVLALAARVCRGQYVPLTDMTDLGCLSPDPDLLSEDYQSDFPERPWNFFVDQAYVDANPGTSCAHQLLLPHVPGLVTQVARPPARVARSPAEGSSNGLRCLRRVTNSGQGPQALTTMALGPHNAHVLQVPQTTLRRTRT